jgi:hypothetical protein
MRPRGTHALERARASLKSIFITQLQAKRERERERERKDVRACVRACVRTCVWKRKERERKRRKFKRPVKWRHKMPNFTPWKYNAQTTREDTCWLRLPLLLPPPPQPPHPLLYTPRHSTIPRCSRIHGSSAAGKHFSFVRLLLGVKEISNSFRMVQDLRNLHDKSTCKWPRIVYVKVEGLC